MHDILVILVTGIGDRSVSRTVFVMSPVMGPAIGILVMGPSTYWRSTLYLSRFSRHPEHEDSMDTPILPAHTPRRRPLGGDKDEGPVLWVTPPSTGRPPHAHATAKPR